MKQILIISGKGGTGKTCLTGAVSRLVKDIVICDCDVDAPDLHLILAPEIKKGFSFIGSKLAVIHKDKCTECGKCIEVCEFDAVNSGFCIDPLECEGCSVCRWFCPEKAISMNEKEAGKYYVSEIDNGFLVHALLNPGEENSGKLVTQVKKKARQQAKENNNEYILIDGPPGIGCAVIASLSGVDLAVIITEPTQSGIHDMERTINLAGQFGIQTKVVINKCDLNLDVTKKIKEFLKQEKIAIIEEIPFSDVFMESLKQGKTVVECDTHGEIKKKIENIKREVFDYAEKR
ncbi:MAG: ATP-binding protein [Elusimicrobiota bacterium]